jgi:hypothetical protein
MVHGSWFINWGCNAYCSAHIRQIVPEGILVAVSSPLCWRFGFGSRSNRCFCHSYCIGKHHLSFMNPSSTWPTLWDSLQKFRYDIASYGGCFVVGGVSGIKNCGARRVLRIIEWSWRETVLGADACWLIWETGRSKKCLMVSPRHNPSPEPEFAHPRTDFMMFVVCRDAQIAGLRITGHRTWFFGHLQ